MRLISVENRSDVSFQSTRREYSEKRDLTYGAAPSLDCETFAKETSHDAKFLWVNLIF